MGMGVEQMVVPKKPAGFPVGREFANAAPRPAGELLSPAAFTCCFKKVLAMATVCCRGDTESREIEHLAHK